MANNNEPAKQADTNNYNMAIHPKEITYLDGNLALHLVFQGLRHRLHNKTQADRQVNQPNHSESNESHSGAEHDVIVSHN
jgi:hypothetical protein